MSDALVRQAPPSGTAAITGAAGGLGAAFARALARRGYSLVLTDRDASGLEALASGLRKEHTVRIDTVVADLNRTEDINRLEQDLVARGDLSLLVNNAGFGTYSLFHEADLDRQIDMVQVHVVATMRLCRAILPGMVDRGRGSVINVASAAAFMRFPRDATYIGTKSFLVAFTECVAIELAGTGVCLQALCPGWLHTEFSSTGDYARVGYRSPIPRWLFASPEEVAEASLRTVGNGSVTYIPTLRAHLVARLIGSRVGLAALAAMRRVRDRHRWRRP